MHSNLKQENCSESETAGYGIRHPDRLFALIFRGGSDNIAVNHRSNLALYSSFEYVDGQPVLFFPDRKHFLVGKGIDRNLLKNAVFPK